MTDVSQLNDGATAAPLSTARVRLPSRRALRRTALKTAVKLLPGFTARQLARRYVAAGSALLDELSRRSTPYTAHVLGPDLAILRHGSPDSCRRRVLVVPGHEGHFRQFTRLVRALSKEDCCVDLLVLPGHLYAGENQCTLRDIVEAVLEVDDRLGPYDGVVAHCLSSNAVLYALDAGLTCSRVALISAPLDLSHMVRFGGRQYGLPEAFLDRFVTQVNALSTPYVTNTPWRPIAAARQDPILMVHACDDYLAPVEDITAFAELCPRADLALLDHGDHNGILGSKQAVARVSDFMCHDVDQGAIATQVTKEKAGP